ncbi:MAG: serine/threonine-protein kinase [Planctomycetota bacterium]
MADLTGRRLGDYQILRRLGAGGMADVYAARQLALQRDVALKILRAESNPKPDDQRRFRREAQAAAQLNHPAIVQVYDIGEIESSHFIAQELIDGKNLNQRLDEVGVLSTEDAVDVLTQVAAALQVAHAAGITHRDIKPENIMRAVDGTIKVTDFGLARMLTSPDASTANLTQAGLTLGTPRYMSPEQIQGHAVDCRSDLYSLGVTMYHLLTGNPPFDADEPLALAVKHLHDTPAPINRQRGRDDLPDWLTSIVMTCLQKAPEDRFQSANELVDTIAASVGDASMLSPVSRGGLSSATVTLQRATDAAKQQRIQRRKRQWQTTFVVTAGLLAGFGLSTRVQTRSVAAVFSRQAVERMESIELQYLTAISQNRIDAWQAVKSYFPLDDAGDDLQTRVEYHHKASLQLARLYVEQKRFDRAKEQLNSLRDSSVSRSHRCLAMVLQYQIAVATRDEPNVRQFKQKIRQTLAELKADNPAAYEMIREVVPMPQQAALGWL